MGIHLLKLYKKYFFVFALPLVFVLFQNCGSPMESLDSSMVATDNQSSDNSTPLPPQMKSCGATPHGGTETRRMYLSASAETCEGIDRTRTCNDGVFSVWSGSELYAHVACTVTNPQFQSCGGTPHGDYQVQTFYQNNSVPYGQSCGTGTVQRRQCNDGTFSPWDGSLIHTSCQVAAPANCGNIAHGAYESANFYQNSIEPYGGMCTPVVQSRQCNNGTLGAWSGNLTITSCQVANGASCGSTPHGATDSRQRYRKVNGQCESGNQTRLCSNGSFGAWSTDFTLATCQNDNPSSGVSLNSDVFFIGHSLVSPTLPGFLGQLVSSQQGSAQMNYQVINGSPLAYNWDNSASAQGQNSRVVLPQGQHEVLVITEAVPLRNHLMYSDSFGNASRFYNLAVSGNSNISTYMYETWHCINSGGSGCAYDNEDHIPWRQRLTEDLDDWESIVDHVNSQKPAGAKDMLLIPAGQAMARLYDEIQAGRVPGVSNYRDLFTDDIHLTNLGFYYISMVHYATIYQRNPAGLTRNITLGYTNYQVPTQALADKLQELAWTTVCSYPRSGVSCN